MNNVCDLDRAFVRRQIELVSKDQTSQKELDEYNSILPTYNRILKLRLKPIPSMRLGNY
jgi:hypothetical protein